MNGDFMKFPYFFLLAGLVGFSAFADPIVGIKAIYDYKREAAGKVEFFVQTKEVLGLHSKEKVYSEKTVYLDLEGKVVLEGTIPDQPYERYQTSDIFFGVRCATKLNGKTVDGVKYSFG